MPGNAEITRHNFRVDSDPGVSLALREVSTEKSASGQPLILLHGARVPSVPSYDLSVPGGSLAAALAQAGLRIFLLDVRGYGGSTRPPEMMGSIDAHPPLVRADSVFRDIDAAVDAVAARTGRAKVGLLGWASGGLWAGHYASLQSRKLSHLILYNPLYGVAVGHPSWGAGSPLEDPERPGRFNRAGFGAYRLCTGEDLLQKWDASIPATDKVEWRDPAVARAYVETTLDTDPESRSHAPAAFRAPSGAIEDSFYAVMGRQLYDASLIRTPTLVIQCSLDFLARAEEIAALIDHLVSAPRLQVATFENATHYAHLDRAERGREALIAAIAAFVSNKKDGDPGP